VDAKDYGTLLHVRVHGGDFWNQDSDATPLYPNAFPAITVSRLIEEGFMSNLRDFPLDDRAVVALNLARSLLVLHGLRGGPWVQRFWTSDNVFFLHESFEHVLQLRNIHNPFISCDISKEPPTLPNLKPMDTFALILTFGLFLLEFGMGEKLPISTLHNGDFSPYKTLNNHYKPINLGSLTPSYKAAIQGCLQFRQFLKQENSHLDEEARIRITIFKKIVQPLQMNLESYGRAALSSVVDSTIIGQHEHPTDMCDTRDLYLNSNMSRATPSQFPKEISKTVGEGNKVTTSVFQHPQLPLPSSNDFYSSQMDIKSHSIPNGFSKSTDVLPTSLPAKGLTNSHIATTDLENKFNRSSISETEHDFDNLIGCLLGRYDTKDGDISGTNRFE
jgi:hypothetical protein